MCAALTVVLVAGCATELPGPKVHVSRGFVKTSDNWNLEVRRYRIDAMDPSRRPVVLCHGLSCNGNFFDIHPSASLARYLAKKGYDVWVPSLRGAGASTKPGFAVARRLMTLRIPSLNETVNLFRLLDVKKWDWSVDDYVHRDLPIIIGHVLKETGQQHVIWIGHSMGGMAMFAYLLTEKPEQVEAFVAVGSPIVLLQPTHQLYRRSVDNQGLLKLGQVFINASIPSAVASVTGTQIADFFYYNRSNISPPVLRLFLRNGIEDVPISVMSQLIEVADTGEFKSIDRKVNYTVRLGEITLPMLFISGKLDNMAPIDCVRWSFQKVGSTDKTYRMFGLANYDSADYGHMDLLIGKNARREVYPYIAQWLRTRDGRSRKPKGPARHSERSEESGPEWRKAVLLATGTAARRRKVLRPSAALSVLAARFFVIPMNRDSSE